MAMTMHCDIVSAEKQIFSGLVEMVVATGTLGDLGVAPGHAPLLTELIPGPVRCVLRDGGEEIYYVSGGYLEVQAGTVTVLADTAIRAGDVDEAAAQQAIEDVQKAIANKDSEFEYSRAATQLAEAVAQLRALKQLKK
ncbi:F0F1 ATP synthase subunit epsilon [Pseudohongiella sp. SYSU M77423]|jgi:F-type H+-transporting ATPase subunit epsilon|uniref:F0F1 ATP synthase subunit epsilon n=1 Tax=unclassified Pseudohongiella TaxID=2629611 RepID=UPI000C962990|nr:MULTISPECIES: F0F1 ATP synthase subunit epsilon [unclassified Pseudohongiella]MAO40833.1 F0F1 ATP synthase subunit epsilon [Pseudohongiella sp.]MAY55155.1 F0F1 ATP synthase subunit epsilon [Gammaproteobacteria bacterium]MEC8859736.1 F0F1 ATP synthase subunit epsilon [Pseudomonadota bacterium]MDH7944284.1 F0F1 ATP synthase subunit epsilon [Pseudohongiella sp. SYSU M77423]HBN13416.1 F0F1 ATP synthase subunit epsilon [Pseudohongiella sp.]|tara:strand:- start:560 stop:973 length:414 start_codon:yes stop_codon:yes gene_type:complete